MSVEIIAGDIDSLKRQLGTASFPQPLLDEYQIRIRMVHSDGNSGPLGSLGIMQLCRDMGYGPTHNMKSKVITTATSWRDIPDDGAARVEVTVMGGTQAGTFRGVGDVGKLWVRLDGMDDIREYRPDLVRLLHVVEDEPIEETNARAKLFLQQQSQRLEDKARKKRTKVDPGKVPAAPVG